MLEFYAGVEEEARSVEAVFEKATGSRLWSAQRAWVKRVVKGRSFAAIAPTGVGKTTFGVLMAVYLAAVGGRSYIVVPTTPLVRMVEERLRRLSEAAGVDAVVLAIHSRMGQRQRREALEALREGRFHVLVTTAQYMIRNASSISSWAAGWGPAEPAAEWGPERRWWRRWRESKRGFWLVFVDDVDAVLKSGRSVDAVLEVLGLRGVVEDGWELLRLQRRLVVESERARAELERRLRRLREAARRKGRRLSGEDVRRLREEVFRERLEPLYRRLRELEERIASARERAAVLVVSSATGRPRGSRVRLFQALLGFQAGAASETIRNIVDSYTYPERGLEEKLLEVLRRLGDGGLVYVPVDAGTAYAEKLADLITRETGLRAEAFTSRNPGALDRFRSGETNILVGVAVYYGVAVRGLDLPERIRYAVFAGVPRHRFSARLDDPHPYNIVRALSILAEHGPRDVASRAQALLGRLRGLLRRMSQAAVQRLAEELRSGEPGSDAARAFMEALGWLREALGREDVWEALERADDVAVVREDGETYIMVPDVATYIQASGRTSRLFAGGITKGLSVVVVDDERLFRGLERRTRWLLDTEWRRFEELDLPRLLEEINRDRERVRAVLEGRAKPEYMELVKTALMIVESPNKARTIAGFFGKPSARQLGPLRVYEVSTGDYVLMIAASGGHVYDLVKPPTPRERVEPGWLLGDLRGSVEGYNWAEARNIHGVLVTRPLDGGRRFLPVYSPLARCLSCGHQWAVSPDTYRPGGGQLRCPVCGSPLVKNSWDVVEALRDVASEADVVMIGTDPDTEGEKIGYDLASLVGVAARSLVRVEFHEVTRKAILEAIHSPRPFDTRLVEAQIVRRAEDRWIGFTLSPVLWTKFWPGFCSLRLAEARASARRRLRGARAMLNAIERLGNMAEECRRPNYNLSAGRVQTPVLGWIVEHTLGNQYLRIPLYRLRFQGPGGAELVLEVRGDEASREIAEALEEARRLLEEALREHRVLERLPELEEARRRKRAVIKRVNDAITKKSRASARVVDAEEAEEDLNPLPPFTTDTMLAEAAARLGIPAPEAMSLAQDLFELGLITYHRTDSTRVSDAGIAVAREYLRYRYGEEALEKLFRPRRWGRGGAHEAIRPTRPIDVETLRRLVEEGSLQLARPLTRNHYRLYDLIFRRFIASQMAPARVVRQRARILVELEPPGEEPRRLERRVERIVEVRERAWLDIYPVVEPEPRLVPGEYRLVKAEARVWSPVQLLSQAEVVRMMKERGIGRPSTYAKIIDTLLRRGYVVSRGRGGLLVATMRGIGVYDFLMARFGELVSEEVTRRLQETMDSIEQGLVNYEDVLLEILRRLWEALHSPRSGLTPEEAEALLPVPRELLA